MNQFDHTTKRSELEASNLTKMSDRYIFVDAWPPRKRAYDGRIRAFVLRNPKRRKGHSTPKIHDKLHTPDTYLQSGGIRRQDLDSCSSPESLKQSELDPFNSFARPIMTSEMHLLQQYIHGTYVWEGRHTKIEGWRPSPELFLGMNLQSTLTIDVMLAYSAKCFANLYPDHLQARIGLHFYQSRCFAALKQALELEGPQHTPRNLIAISGIICMLVETPGSQYCASLNAELRFHSKALRMLVENAGGLDAVTQTCLRVGWLICWIMSFGYTFDAISSELSRIFWTEESAGHVDTMVPAPQKPYSIFAELVTFYASAYDVAKKRALLRERICATVEGSAPPNSVMSLFCEDTKPWKALSFKDQLPIHRLVPLIYINLLYMSAWSASLSVNQSLYALYNNNLNAINDNLEHSTAPLMWALMTNVGLNTFNDYSMLKRTFRLMSALEQLAPDVVDLMSRTLFDFVSVPPELLGSCCHSQDENCLPTAHDKGWDAKLARWPLPDNLRKYVNALQMLVENSEA